MINIFLHDFWLNIDTFLHDFLPNVGTFLHDFLPHRHLFRVLLSYSHDVNASSYYNAEFTALIANLKLDEFVQSRTAQMDTM